MPTAQPRQKQHTDQQTGPTSDMVTMTFVEGQTASLQFDFCSIAPCSGYDHSYASSDKYVCVTTVRCSTIFDKGCNFSYLWVLCNSVPERSGSETD